jgi:hypothetical protein
MGQSRGVETVSAGVGQVGTPSTMSIGSVCVSGEFDFDVLRTCGENVI